jgi:FtsP/CotA-like multicopper oxidase with cupredoxin domain
MKTLNRRGVFDANLRVVRIVGTALMAVCFGASNAYANDDDSRHHRRHHQDNSHYAYGHEDNDDEHDRRSPVPPEDDPSHFTDLVTGDLPAGLPDANQGTFEGGNTGTVADTEAANVLQAEDQRDDGTFNVPTNGPPSPLFGAQPFTQQMLRFEEFGPERLKFKNKRPRHWQPLPAPVDARSTPDADALEGFLTQRIWPNPTKFSNDEDLNPWQSEIEAFLGRPLDDPPAEGRPPGLGWSHQRWNEFKPEVYFQTAQTGARTNGGFRDGKQGHKYKKGEFGPGGLYHNTVGTPGFEGTTNGIDIRFHPNMPVQDHEALWTFDGTLPPKLLNVRYGEPVLMRHYNALPIDVAANRGFGVHTISTHEHNGHNPAESDGYTNSFFFPGQFYDYRWPMTLAGSDSINTDGKDRQAGAPNGKGGIKRIPGDWRETMSTHWFHDHMLDFTAQNVYKGNAAMMNYYSAIDRGNEAIDDGVNLRLPSGTKLDWGNRDYDVNLLLAEKAWDSEGQLWFNPFNLRGFIGDVMTVNWLYKPYLDVRARKYRFRLLNGSVSRYFKIALVDGTGNPVPFYMVANDGNIMEHTVYFENGELPTQGIAERYDIIVDFSKFKEGDTLYMVNLLQHKDGQATDKPVALADIVSGAYQAEQVDDDGNGTADRWANGDPVVGKFLEFRVHKYEDKDRSMDPSMYVAGKKKMIPLRRPSEAELANALHRSFEFERQPTDDKPWVIETDGGKGFAMDPRRVSAAPQENSSGLEVWRLINSGTWSHPIHIHFEEGIILRRNGQEPPEWEKWARKDVYRLGPQSDSGDLVEIALRFREFAGTYMEHCHNTQHEDHAMLLRWDIEHPGQVKLMPTPMPTWDGVSYVDSVALPTFRTGDAVGEFGPELDPVSVWVKDMVIGELDDIRDHPIGDALSIPEPDNERGTATFPLTRGTNIDADGNQREVWYFLHDVSDEDLAETLGLAWAGGLVNVPVAATAEASVSETGYWTFYGDLPNPVWANDINHPGIPDVDDNNTYSPLRRVNYGGKDVVFNAIIIQWGDEPWEHNRIDESCISFPDLPANTSCMYNGNAWGGLHESGHVVELVTDGPTPHVSIKLHKSWSEEGDYLPYYIVLDTFPFGPSKAMGVPYVPKHQFLADAAVPLVQFLPPAPIRPGYPPTPADGNGILGGGPFGSQVGVPSYFMPEDDYSPMWHIGFAHWLTPATDSVGVVKGLKQLKELRAEGKLEILEFPAPPQIGLDNYDFDNLNSPHVVNCPTPMTIDTAIYRARNAGK